jgi:hypothetical protein
MPHHAKYFAALHFKETIRDTDDTTEFLQDFGFARTIVFKSPAFITFNKFEKDDSLNHPGLL